jgi:hypothetical protein
VRSINMRAGIGSRTNLYAEPSEKQVVPLSEQPIWAQKVLKQKVQVVDEFDEKDSLGSELAHQLPGIRTRKDIENLLLRCEGVIVSEELLCTYPEARRDILAMVAEGVVRHRAPVPAPREIEPPPPPLGFLLVRRFESEIERLGREQQDTFRELYHSIRVQAGDVRAELQRPTEEGPAKKRRATAKAKRKLSANIHMEEKASEAG